jgi:chitinase
LDRTNHVADIPADRLTDIIYAFVAISDSGECVSANTTLDQINLPQLKGLKQQHPQVKLLISVGGYSGSARFSDVAFTSEARQRFAHSCVQFMQQNGFDGIDIDWELPVSGGMAGNVHRPEDKQDYTGLLAELRTQLDALGAGDGEHYLLTIAAPICPSEFKNIDLEAIQQYLDWINLMAYAFYTASSPVTNFNAPLYPSSTDPAPASRRASLNGDTAVKAYLGAGVPPDKLVLGVPFYGRGCQGVPDVNHGLYQSDAGAATDAGVPKGTWQDGAIAYGPLEKYYLGSYARYWQDETQEPWLFNPGTGLIITYEDPQSLGLKADYVRTRHLGGITVWHLSDDVVHHSLLNNLYAHLHVNTQSSSPRWSAWVYRPFPLPPTVTLVVAGAAPTTYTLPLPNGASQCDQCIAGSVAISHGWEYLAYVTSGDSRDLVLFDRKKQTAAHFIPLPKGVTSTQNEDRADENSFNADSTSLALGYALTGGQWAIDVYDIASSSRTARLISDTPAVTALQLPKNSGTPDVRRYNQTQIVFTLGGDPSVSADSYVWDMSANTVTAAPTYHPLAGDVFDPTGETLMTSGDSLLAYDPTTGKNIPFYSYAAQGQGALLGPRFIQNGELIGYSSLYTVSEPDPTNPGTGQMQGLETFTVVDRSGMLVGVLPDPHVRDAIGWQDGLIYLSAAETKPYTLKILNTRNGLAATPTVFQAGGIAGLPPSELLKAPNIMNSTGPIKPWGQLTASPTPVSGCPAPQLSAGGQGRVTPGASNNLRAAPATGAIVAAISAGAVVDVLDGTICTADGVLWWLVYYNGKVGYSAEGQGNTYFVVPVTS